MTQSIEYVVKVAGTQQAANQIGTVEHALEKTEVQARRAGAAIDTAVKPTRNLGQAGLEASRAIEDLQYGIGGVVNNIPSLVMALGGGAGLTAAISLAAVGVNQLYKQFSAMPDATAAAATAAKTHMQSVVESVAEANDELNRLLVDSARGRIAAQEAAVEQAKVATERARSQFRDQFGINPLDMDAMGRVASQAQGGMDIWVKRWNVQKNQMEQVRVAAKDVMAAYRETTDAYNLAVEEQVLLSKYRAIEAERQKQAEIDAAVDAANAITKAEEAAAKKRADIAKKAGEDRLRLMYDLHVAMLDEEDQQLADVAKARRRDADKEAKEQARLMQKNKRAEEMAEKRANDARIKEHKRTLDAMRRAEQEFSDFAVGMASMTTDQMIGSFTDYLMMKAAGEKDAELKAIAGFMSQTGQMLVASGVRGIFEGAIISANPLTPGAGAGMIGLGAAAVGVGMAMAGGGAAIGAAIPSDATSGGSATSATRDPGAAPRTGSGGSSGGPMIVNVTYGAGGPLPEDIAREIHKVTASGNRRRGAA